MGGGGPHEVFKALGPADWAKDITPDGSPDGLRDFMLSTFSEAQCIIDSIPVATGITATSTAAGRPRASTDSSVAPGYSSALPGRAPQTDDRAKALRKDWKEVKVNPSENPLGIHVYKMSGKDGKGAWFARRSLHEGLSFERWKLGMEREFAETMKVKKDPGSGNIRGIGAERCVENTIVDGCGKAKVYQLSAQFPGPTTPRDFVTLMLTSDSALETPVQDGQKQARHFIVVSKPCVHPECPQRSGYIRGYYESVEFIREIKVNRPLRRTQSSTDTRPKSGEPNLAAEAAKAALEGSAAKEGESGRPRGKTIAFAGADGSEHPEKDAMQEDDDSNTMIEWLMVTRSDPGGSVPRFMVEKGTPGGIAGDANKFLKWVSSKNLQDFDEADEMDSKLKGEAQDAEETAVMHQKSSADPTANVLDKPTVQPKPRLSQTPAPRSTRMPNKNNNNYNGYTDGGEEDPSPQGFYGVIANALGMVASHLPNPFGTSAKGGDTDASSSIASSDISDDTASSIHSFHSLESGDEGLGSSSRARDDSGGTGTGSAAVSVRSMESSSATAAAAGAGSLAGGADMTRAKRSATQHEKELRKLEQRKKKMDERHARDLAKRADDSTKDDSAVLKLKEKHERDRQRQEEKYQRELRKLEQRRENEERKAERRKAKQLEKQEKSDLGMELERLRAERDVALKQIEMLKEQVGELQGQNTLLVARLGREGITIAGGADGVFSDLSNGRRPVGGSARGPSRSIGSASSTSIKAASVKSAKPLDPGVQVDGPACVREPVKG
ncbi:uncharacterized protein B0I36DRAFT_358317 [Microdochium trichocladiopsis]|uniref:DUF3074 domain-containing protein n=1 Tax=Microdochium trichocladiopsis TaxID=1682393 RepID=A0A9P8YIQ5_9PEZI|nr:uncharacterized protein B0I36DRAFT_358317 [Microdochium trichocladiopsis]KAH7041119.1 hypothetical protein B0I36DRAFT_358317 [Microdochium trichocladiopsis]